MTTRPSLSPECHPKTFDLQIRVEVEHDSGRVSATCRLDGESEEYARVWGSQNFWTAFYALTPYLVDLCNEDLFGAIPHG